MAPDFFVKARIGCTVRIGTKNPILSVICYKVLQLRLLGRFFTCVIIFLR
jgi:hypothetical protein